MDDDETRLSPSRAKGSNSRCPMSGVRCGIRGGGERAGRGGVGRRNHRWQELADFHPHRCPAWHPLVDHVGAGAEDRPWQSNGFRSERQDRRRSRPTGPDVGRQQKRDARPPRRCGPECFVRTVAGAEATRLGRPRAGVECRPDGCGNPRPTLRPQLLRERKSACPAKRGGASATDFPPKRRPDARRDCHAPSDGEQCAHPPLFASQQDGIGPAPDPGLVVRGPASNRARRARKCGATRLQDRADRRPVRRRGLCARRGHVFGLPGVETLHEPIHVDLAEHAAGQRHWQRPGRESGPGGLPLFRTPNACRASVRTVGKGR